MVRAAVSKTAGWGFESLLPCKEEKVRMEKLREQVDRGVQFFKDVEVEGKRISWPSIKETVRSTGAVIIISAILTSFLGLVDFLFSLIVKYILN